MEKVMKFMFSLFLVLVAGGLCSYFTRWGITNWYSNFDKPLYVPPRQFFITAWSLIYALLIISYYRILNSDSSLKPVAGRFFLLQLLLQILWCALFFYKGMLLPSFLVILWLDYTVYRMIKSFLKIDLIAGALNYFYLFYIGYATFLNFVFLYANGYVITF